MANSGELRTANSEWRINRSVRAWRAAGFSPRGYAARDGSAPAGPPRVAVFEQADSARLTLKLQHCPFTIRYSLFAIP